VLDSPVVYFNSILNLSAYEQEIVLMLKLKKSRTFGPKEPKRSERRLFLQDTNSSFLLVF